MELQLERPIVFFDIESTGLNIASDGIAELSFVKVLPDGEQKIKTWKLKPWDYAKGKQIPLKDSDLAGFNSTKFDLPMLAEELERVRIFLHKDIDINLHEKKMIDVQTIYHALEPRNLKAAYRFYCGGEDFENAHTAEADTLATYEVLKGQLKMYKDTLKNDVDFLSRFGSRPRTIDYAGRLIEGENGEPIISFGKHRGKTARSVYFSEPSYFAWIENGEFTLDTKRQFDLLRLKFENEKKEAKSAAGKPLTGKDFDDATAELQKHFGCDR